MNRAASLVKVILVGSFVASGVSAQTPTPYPDFLIDLNQDGDIGSKDLLILLHRWGVQGIATPTPTSTEAPTNPDAITINLPAFRMVRIPAGSFMMGSPDTERSRESNEGPLHQVTIDYDFYMGETEVTQSQWAAVMGSNPASGFGEGNDYPVYHVSWEDCQEFLTALNALGQGTFRLPSEAEWEYACRAGSTTRFFFGDSLGCADGCENCETSKGEVFIERRSYALWFCGNSEGGAHLVRQRFANGFGLYDMAGNVFEWCQDDYHTDYTDAPINGSAWESGGGDGTRVLRGGGWNFLAKTCRSANRIGRSPIVRTGHFGLRLVRDPS